MSKRLLRCALMLLITLMVAGGAKSVYAAGNEGVSFSNKLHPTYKTVVKTTVYTKAGGGKKVATIGSGHRVLVNKQVGQYVRIKCGRYIGYTKLSHLKRIKNGWVECGGSWYWKRSTGTIKSNLMYQKTKKLYQYKSLSKVVLYVDKSEFKAMTFQYLDGRYTPHMIATTNIGMVDWETPCGLHTVFHKQKLFHKHGLIYPYACKFWGGCFAHSQACYETKDGALNNVVSPNIEGLKSTHGCISMNNKQAKWFYDHCIVGKTNVIVEK